MEGQSMLHFINAFIKDNLQRLETLIKAYGAATIRATFPLLV